MDFLNKETFSESLQMVQPGGWTPIALALESIKDDAVLYDRSVIYLVSDGIETCDGDPVKIVKELKDDGINVSVNIIGFDIDDEGQKLLKEISDEGNGNLQILILNKNWMIICANNMNSNN